MLHGDHERAAMSSPVASRLQLLAAAALFSTGGAAVKATALTGWQVASFRSGIAALAIVLLIPAARRGWNWRVLLVGVAYAATLILFVIANKLTTAANTIFLQSSAPLYVLLLGPLLLKEPLRRDDLAFIAVVALGLALFFVGVEPPVATAPDPARGNILALLSGTAWAFTIMGLRWLERGSGPEPGSGSALATVVAGNAIACVVGLPFALPIVSAGPIDWMTVVYLGVFQIGLAYVLLARAIRHVPALEASVLLLAEPALNPIWAWMAHGEVPSPWSLAGGSLILGATLLRTWVGVRAVRGTPFAPAGLAGRSELQRRRGS
jgi:DME family drug/metabolite transporter